MDGYACRSADIEGASEDAPVTLTVIEDIRAGAFPTKTISSGEATRIATGAPVPDGADTVVRVEDTDGGVVFRDLMTVTLTCDHRVVYGADGAQFLSRLRDLLERPLELTL